MRPLDKLLGLKVNHGGTFLDQRKHLDGYTLLPERQHFVEDKRFTQLGKARHDIGHLKTGRAARLHALIDRALFTQLFGCHSQSPLRLDRATHIAISYYHAVQTCRIGSALL